MISTKETAIVRLEVDLEILVPELRILEDDIDRMSIKQFMEVWAPETIGARMMVQITNFEENKNEKRKET